MLQTGKNQTEVAELLGVSPGYLSKLVNGKKSASSVLLMRLEGLADSDPGPEKPEKALGIEDFLDPKTLAAFELIAKVRGCSVFEAIRQAATSEATRVLRDGGEGKEDLREALSKVQRQAE